MKSLVFVVVSFGLVRAAHAQPAFCKVPGIDRMNISVEAAFADDANTALPNLVGASCERRDREALRRAADLEAARAKWSKRLDLTAAEWTDVAEWAMAPRGPAYIKFDPKQAPSTYDAVDQYGVLTNTATRDHNYAADMMGARLTETGRLAYLKKCLDGNAKNGDRAVCQGDFDAFDPTKIAGELRASTKHGGYERVAIRIELDQLRPKLAAHAKAMKDLAAKDPGYVKLFATAADARKKWAPDPKVVALVAAMDDARISKSNKAYDGCGDATWAAMQSAIANIPAKKFHNLKDEPGNPFMTGAIGVLVNDPNAYLAALALYTCTAINPKRDILTRFIGAAMQRWPGFRGPRTAAHTALLTTDIKLDDRDAKIQFTDVNRYDWLYGDSGSMGGGRGPVAAVKPGGATVTVEFVKKMRTEQVCTDWKDTNRISMISASGTVYYEYNCLKYGTINVNDAPGPKTVNARHTAGVAPGTSVSIMEDIVGGVWSKPGTPPTHVFGVPVK